MKRILLGTAIVIAAGVFLVLNLGASNPTPIGEYRIELDNAFGLVKGAQFKVAGVPAGKIAKIDLDQSNMHALVTVDVTEKGFGQFYPDAFCESRPQALIGEYFVECQPGSHGQPLKPGATIPVTRTQSTIPLDLLADVLRLPYRERLTIIINELGGAVAGRAEDVEAALRRALPALTETDNLLNVLGNDSHTIQQLTSNSDQLVTALADNSQTVTRFIQEAGKTATDTATQQNNLRGTLAQLPGFLEQLRPSLAQLGAATDANTPVLRNLNEASGNLDRLLRDLPPFTHSAVPAIRSLGRASVSGTAAVKAAAPTVRDLTRFAKSTPELAQNLAIVLHDLDDRGRAVEPDTRSPGGKGFTGLEALLQWVFNQTLALNTFGPFGHLLAVDLFADPECSPYATPATVAQGLAQYGPNYRHCYAELGPNQPGVTTTDPSNPTACVPDPGGVAPQVGPTRAPSTTACKLTAADVARSARAVRTSSNPTAHTATGAATSPGGRATNSSGSAASGSASSSSGSATSGQTLGQMLSGALSGANGSSGSASSGGSGSSSQGGQSGNQTQQLLNYLLAP